MRLEATNAAHVHAGVAESDQTMPIGNVFWSHFSPNFVPATWIIGVLVIVVGLDVRTGLAAILIGNLLGAIPVAACAVMGPTTRLTQMEASRSAFGRIGVRLPASLNWLCCIGWDAANNVPAAAALVLLLHGAGISLPFVAALAVLALLQLGASAAGHDLVQALQKYLGYVLLALFGATGAIAVAHGGAASAPAHGVKLADFVLATAIVASNNLAWVSYSSDYTRYLPRATSRRAIFWLSLAGIFGAGVVIEVFGLATASAIKDPSPGALVGKLGALTGGFAPVALFAVALSSIAVNAVNDYTASTSLISAGVRLPRPFAAAASALLGFLIAAASAGHFAETYVNYLLLLLYWCAPWAGIVLADWFVTRSAGYPSGWTRGATIFTVTSLVTIGLFSSTPLYTGPIAKALGGADIGYLLGFAVAGIWYAAGLRRGAAR